MLRQQTAPSVGKERRISVLCSRKEQALGKRGQETLLLLPFKIYLDPAHIVASDGDIKEDDGIFTFCHCGNKGSKRHSAEELREIVIYAQHNALCGKTVQHTTAEQRAVDLPQFAIRCSAYCSLYMSNATEMQWFSHQFTADARFCHGWVLGR